MKRSRLGRVAGAAMAVAAVVTMTGCESGDAGMLLGSATGAEERAAGAAIDVPSMADLREALSLDDEQVTALEPLLASWKTAVAERHARFEAHRAERAERRAMHRAERDADGPPPRARERRHTEMRDGRPHRPAMTFVAESGAVLDADQMVALAGLLESRRATIRGADAQGPGRHGRGSRGPGGPGAHGLGIGAHFAARQLDADPETVRALHEALRSQHETLRPLWDGYLEGAVSAEALRDGLRAARENVEGSAETLLDADQRGKLDGFVAEMRERAAEQQLERLDDRLERHADLLVKALDLDETRAAAVRGVLDRAGTEWRGTIEAGGSGSIQIEESVYRTLTLLASTKDAIRAELTEDQARVFDAFAELMPR